ncbi:thiamin pyrophosphokinase 2 [Hemiscyllium ocellatum]|uniref:thiamin pyrophosphokinase 2 n=1 Tax=Hemiscyllium ocellatum TaxID=170820 RepID=UPI00296767F0|nr:thiamin pyrophosphokinase 2 [Hemiscyllium ocellatum]
MAGSRSWAEGVLQLLGRMNSFHTLQGSSKPVCKQFCVGGQAVGVVQPRMLPLLRGYPEVFQITNGHVELRDHLRTFQQRSTALEQVLRDWRERGLFNCLSKWRNEEYPVMSRFCDPPLMNIERAAVGLFGVRSYGVHLNGFVRHDDGRMSMWIGRRTIQKETYPGRLDNLVAGGIPASLGVMETLLKECQEEACIPDSIARNARPAGTISYTYEDDAGIFPECQFVYDLEVPVDFRPEVGDGEVLEFYLWSLEQVIELLPGSEFKPNCAMVVLDFAIRHGLLHADNERHYQQLVEGLHREL